MDDNYSDDEEPERPRFEKLERPGYEKTDGKLLKPAKSAIRNPKERAYKLVPKLDDPNIISDLVNQTKGKVLEGITVEMMSAMSADYAKKLRDITFRTRRPLKPVTTDAFIQDVDGLFQDEGDLRLRTDAIPLDALPPVDSFFISTEEDIGLAPGCIVATDVVLTYYNSLGKTEQPKQIYGSWESASLRVLYPVVGGGRRVECVLDTGSQIISMAQKVAEGMGLGWDPDIRIVMQSANGQLKQSAGLSRNVPFTFGDIVIYLQVHIIDQPAYQILLGRPFDILTESIVQNNRNGSQSITLRDPNQNRRITLPTYARGADPFHGNKGPSEEELRGTRVETKEQGPVDETSVDFQVSSRN